VLGDLDAPGEALLGLQTIDHRAAKAGGLANFWLPQNPDWRHDREGGCTHGALALMLWPTRRVEHLDARRQSGPHSNGRQGWRGFARAQRRGAGSAASIARSRASQSSTSDRSQPTCRPRYRRFCGKRRRSIRPEITSFGRRVRRATSWALRSSWKGGRGSLTQGDRVTVVGERTGSSEIERMEFTVIPH
jgi:hypothetical protein